MIGRDLHNTLAYLRAISPTRQTNSDTAVVSQWIDVGDHMGVEFVIMTGNLTDTNATFTVLVEESDDQSTINAVADADLLPTPNNLVATAPEVQASFTFADDNVVRAIGYVGIRRWVRLTITPSGNDAGNLDVAVLAVCLPRYRGTTTGI